MQCFFCCFFTCSYPSHVKHLVLRAFLEDCLPEMLSTLGVLDERCMKKSKKTLHRSEVRAIFAVKTHIKCAIWNSSGDRPGIRRSPAKWSQEPLVGGPLPTRHGQDDGSLTNSLKKVRKIRKCLLKMESAAWAELLLCSSRY